MHRSIDYVSSVGGAACFTAALACSLIFALSFSDRTPPASETPFRDHHVPVKDIILFTDIQHVLCSIISDKQSARFACALDAKDVRGVNQLEHTIMHCMLAAMRAFKDIDHLLDQ